MRLIHHDEKIVSLDPGYIYPLRDYDAYFKPKGLWVSDEDSYGWSHWCEAENFHPEGLKYEHLVELRPDNSIFWISTVDDLDKFHETYKCYVSGETPIGDFDRPHWCNWKLVRDDGYQGIIITPYQWERRLEYMWYYGWDCASGCIWDLSAIKTFTPLLKQLKGKTE